VAGGASTPPGFSCIVPHSSPPSNPLRTGTLVRATRLD
jgi:hypothetical protein